MLGIKTAALPASLRRTNQRTVISLLLRLGRASRADLAKAAGISQPTAGKITSELLRLGILQEAGLADHSEPNANGNASRLGRPGQLLRLESRRARFLVVELGVSETSISALPVAIQFEDRWTTSFATPESPEAWLARLKVACSPLRRERLWGILISVPGIVDEHAGKVLFSPNLHWLEKTSLPDLVRGFWDLPVLLVQEIRALALGHLTAEPSSQDFLLIDFGQGVGGAVVLDGELFSHPSPLSGEFGHTPIPGNRRRCGCGAVGCLETLVSERGLLQSFTEASPRRSRTRAPLSWKDLSTHVSEAGIEPWLVETLNATATVVAGALNVLGVRRLVVTGGLAELPACIAHLTGEVTKGAMWGRFGDIIIHTAPHRRAAGLVAAGIDRLLLPNEDEVNTTGSTLGTVFSQGFIDSNLDSASSNLPEQRRRARRRDPSGLPSQLD